MNDTAAALLALADRCEREEPSRALDDAIAVAAGYPEINLRVYRVPYTTSLDAAATLVPKTWDWVNSSGVTCIASLSEHPPSERQADAAAKTPAMALCAAALRARAATVKP